MTSSRISESHGDEAATATDVIAFGQKFGRVLSDGQILGRAEPFAKVFPSSRAVKRAVGLIAWAVLEDIALDAHIDERGRLVADTNAWRIAANLGLNKDTVAKHLSRLRDHGFMLQEEGRQVGFGRYEPCRYVLGPSCVERSSRIADNHGTAGQRPCPTSSDTVQRSVSDPTHGGVDGASQKAVAGDTQRPRAEHGAPGAGELLRGLCAAGVEPPVAADLVAHHPASLIRDALDAVEVRERTNPAGWLCKAIAGGWDVSARAERVREARARQQARETENARVEQARSDRHRDQQLTARWSQALSAALDDDQLRTAIEALTDPLPGLERHSTPAVQATLLAWCRTVASCHPDVTLPAALAADLRAGPTRPDLNNCPALDAIPVPEHPHDGVVDLRWRINSCLAHEREPAQERSAPSLSL